MPSESNETTEQALVALTLQIVEFVQNRSLDSRCAAKLVKRLKKEADAVSERGNATKAGQKGLKKAFDAVDEVQRAHDAALLGTANAALRETDDLARTKESQNAAVGVNRKRSIIDVYPTALCARGIGVQTASNPTGYLTWLFRRLPLAKTVDDYDALLPWKMPGDLR